MAKDKEPAVGDVVSVVCKVVGVSNGQQGPIVTVSPVEPGHHTQSFSLDASQVVPAVKDVK